ncbi:MAG: acyl-CoA/acyl-ACP dehydrogenase [Hellea sp.]|nr:acyl-CoA/acyl-ACP dehydrogenase [Hellea sp.]
MDFSLSPSEQKTIDKAKSDAPKLLGAGPAGQHEAVDFLSWAQYGWAGATIARNQGGMGLTALSTFLAFEQLGREGLSRSHMFSVGAHLFGCAMAIQNHGTEDQKSTYLQKLASGKMIGALALTGESGGSSSQNLGVNCGFKSDMVTLNGTKKLVTNGPAADVLIVSAQETSSSSGLGSTLFVVPTGHPGIEIEQIQDQAGIKDSPMANITFENYQVSKSAILGSKGGGLGLTLSIMRWERSLILAGFLGAAQRDLNRVFGEFKSRTDNNGALIKHQGIGFKLAECYRQLETARWLAYRCAADLDMDEAPILSPALSKLTISQTIVDVALTLNELMAGQAWQGKLGLAEALQDVLGTLSASGTSNIQLNAILSQMGRA